METPKEKRKEPGEVHPKFWERTVKEAFKNDPMRIIIELVKNSADSYTRLHKRGRAQPPFEISIKFYCKKRGPPYVEIVDNAEGMDSDKLKEALKYGTQTSMGEDIDAITSAEKGIGMKDAMMALKDNWLVTIKDGLINERNKHSDFTTGIGRENEKVTDEDRRKFRILKNGTLVMGELPDYFKIRKFSTICEYLEKHFLLRKLLQNNDYKIYAIDGQTNERKLLKYNLPKIEKVVLEDSFEIEYNGYNYPIHLKIYKSKDELEQGKPYGESGLLFFYGKYSVVDFTFFKFDRDPSFSKFFGEVQMEIEKIIRDPNEVPIVDEKRRGLDPEHPFNKKLINEVNQRLVKIQEEESVSEYTFDEKTKKETLRELNEIYKEIKGRGPPSPPPIKPEFFEFYPVWASISEYEPKKHFIVVNSSIIADKIEINLRSNNPKIIVKPTRIEIEKTKTKETYVVRQIELYSETSGLKGEITATSYDPSHSSKLGVEVLENPIFSPKDGFAFVPDKTTIVDAGKKKVQLCINRNVIGASKEISISSDDPIISPGVWVLPDIKNIEKNMIKNIIIIEIPIEVKGSGHIGEKATVTAKYEDNISKLYVTVVPEPTIAGAIQDIRYSSKETKKISDFIYEEGVIEIYYKHPLIKKYMAKKDYKDRLDFLTFLSDVMTREALRAFILTGIKESSSRFSIFDTDHPEQEIESHITREYFDKGPKLHDLFFNLAKSLKVQY
jgi:hypothetical protein